MAQGGGPGPPITSGGPTQPPLTLWSAADRGETEVVRHLLASGGRDVNARNCLGCTPLLYACGSGHVETVRVLLEQVDLDINRRNNDRLTSFMLAMQTTSGANHASNSASQPGSSGPNQQLQSRPENAQDKLRRLMDLPATDDLEWTRQDRWTALMEACNFGHKHIVELLLQTAPNTLDLDAVNIRGQMAEDVANSRGHDAIAHLIRSARQRREHPEELPRLRELQEQVESLKIETRQRLLQVIDSKHESLSELKTRHEGEIEQLTQTIDTLQEQLDEAMKSRLTMITRQVREVKNVEDEIRQLKRQLDNFDRYASTGNLLAATGGSTPAAGPGGASIGGVAGSSVLGGAGGGGSSLGASRTDLSMFDKDFECSVCLDEMRPPVKIFQCKNGHVMCESCKNHPEVTTCPTCRIPLPGPNSLMRNIPMEKLARSYFERMDSIERQYLANASSAIAAMSCAASGPTPVSPAVRRSASSSRTSSPMRSQRSAARRSRSSIRRQTGGGGGDGGTSQVPPPPPPPQVDLLTASIINSGSGGRPASGEVSQQQPDPSVDIDSDFIDWQ